MRLHALDTKKNSLTQNFSHESFQYFTLTNCGEHHWSTARRLFLIKIMLPATICPSDNYHIMRNSMKTCSFDRSSKHFDIIN